MIDMLFENYKEKVKERLSRYFDLKEDFKYNDQDFDLFAASNVRNEKYMASKKLTIYAFENDEYCFVKHIKGLDIEKLDGVINSLKKSIMDFVDPHHEHMSSTITGVLVVDENIEPGLIKKIKKFHYQKTFAFGLKGWADVRLLIIDLKDGLVIPSKKAKKSVKFYLP